MISLLIADDHPLFRGALKSALQIEFPGITLFESQDIEETIQLLGSYSDLDLLLLDLHMPGSNDLYGLIRIRKAFPDIPVVIISGTDDIGIIAKALDAGALGFIPKTSQPNVIADAVNSILQGDVWLPEPLMEQINELPQSDLTLMQKVSELTPQQYRVLCYLHEGLLNKQIAYELDISEATIKAHITAIFRKLEINNRTQAVLIASELKLQLT
ncbi:response regulator transcription factor [Marinomonas sp. 15G1-11]|uniref:Response regulator transcription factor n=1 Tax=Marinomonas phaeophyticola TaxID=3004091 RepID=A0ABT4JWT3_9GAMM|nr:response regulator transcription factor [Marinomonas sp. 15G1-11]MCZ2722844.1 response regulator transcription factor [Marinomonas sp. 15G1-11]